MARVVRLVTTADLVSDGEVFRASALHEAELEDGSRIVLLDDRGWSASPGGPVPLDEVVFTARTVVGPDEPYEDRTFDDMAAGHWATLAATLRAAGVDAGPAALAQLPHDVVLTDALRERTT